MRLPTAAVLALLVSASTAHALDTCDVLVELDEPAPVAMVAFALDYGAAGGDFVGDSNLVGFGPSWGSTPIMCTALGAFDEVTLYDDNAGKLSVFVADAGGIPGQQALVSCVFALTGGFPCPDPSAFGITDASFPDDPFPPPIALPSPPALTIAVSPRTPVCGDGFLEGAEQCDDGDTADADCCTASCQARSSGDACDDGDVCTSGGTCDAQGACVPSSTVVCDDGVACTFDRCDPQQGCISTATPNPQCERWYHGSLDVRDSATDDTKDQLKLKTTFGAGALGDPTQTTGYAVCIYDQSQGTPLLADAFAIPAGAPWTGSALAGKFVYLDRSNALDGVRLARVTRRPGTSNGKFVLKAKGANLTLPGPVDDTRYFAGDPVVLVQLENTAGGCWWLRFDPTRGKVLNQPERYKAKSD